MADIVTGGSVPRGTRFKYKEIAAGVYALVVELRDTASGGNDIVTSGGLPGGVAFRYADQSNGTHAQVMAVN